MDSMKRCLLLVALFLFAVSCDNDIVIVPNLTVDKKEIRLSAYAQTTSVSLSSNVDFDVWSNVEWLTVTKNYSGQESEITIEVTEYNDTENDRSGIIEIQPNGTSETILVTVVQEAMGTIQVIRDDVYYVASDGEKLTISVRNNYDYDVIIPDEAKTWIELEKSSDTKATIETNVKLNISRNEDYTPRRAQIVITIPSYSDRDTITIIQDEGFESLRKLIRANTDCSIFYQALQTTGLADSLIAFVDNDYPIVDYEWTKQAMYDNYSGIHYYETAFETGNLADRIVIPDVRCFKYTVFLVTDSILSKYNDFYCSGGIHNLDELREYAFKVYPEGKELPDTSRVSSLNKLISYHILPSWISYDQLNTSQLELRKHHLFLTQFDMEDFYETMLPHSIMRVSTPYETNEKPLGIYINRKGSNNTTLVAEGVRVAEIGNECFLPSNLTNVCPNGGYHYVNKILVYDEATRAVSLECRMRIMASTLSPDFINSGARGRLNGETGITNIDKMSYTFLPGFCKNVHWSEGSKLYVRYRDKSFGDYNGDEISITGDFDIAFKLPPVPIDGLYEIRVSNNSLANSGRCDRSIVQYYLHQYNPTDDSNDYWDKWKWNPLGVPVNLRLAGDDVSIGMIPDDDDEYDGMPENEREEAIRLNDSILHARGYLKAPDSYSSSSTDYSGYTLRRDKNCYRKIVCCEYLEADKDYYLRIQKVDEEPSNVCPIDYIEIVPESIYSGNEDRH